MNWDDYTEITTPADGDTALVHDVSETTVGEKMKRITWANIKATLKTYFDTLYLALVAPGTSGNVLTSNGTIWTSAAAAGGGGDWTDATGTWSYSSADAPTFVASVNNDQTAIIYPGQRLSLTQTTEKFFIVTAVGSYSGGNTLITMYGGTDYTLAAEAITTPKWSNVKVPSRFPMSAAKWAVTLTDTTQRSQNSPTAGTYYNLGSLYIDAPIGVWNVFYKCYGQTNRSSGDCDILTTLSIANNTIGADNLTFYMLSTPGVSFQTYINIVALNGIIATSKTRYYLNLATLSTGITTLLSRNDYKTMNIVLTSAYL